ncbi:hypothetical protein GQ457_11G026500 [Hibiscus cannabinus]
MVAVRRTDNRGSEVVEQRFALKPSHLSFLVLTSNECPEVVPSLVPATIRPYACEEVFFLVVSLELSHLFNLKPLVLKFVQRWRYADSLFLESNHTIDPDSRSTSICNKIPNSGPLQACESGLVRGNARPSDVEGYSLVKRRGFRKCITNPWRDTHLGIGVSLPLRRTKLGYRAR